MPKPIAADKNGALALLLLGATEDDQRQFGDALTHLKAAAKRLPELADYVAYLSAVADSGLRQFNDTEPALQPVWQSTPASPLVTKAVLLQADSYLQGGNPAAAVTLVQQHLADLSTPQAELLLARAYEAQNNTERGRAALSKDLRRVSALERSIGRRSGTHPLSRHSARRFVCSRPEAGSWRGLHASRQGAHRICFPRLSGESFDLARVRIGAAAYLARDNEAAYKYLISFQATAPDAEAERLYYLLECQRRLNRLDEMNATLEKLTQSYPQSQWRLEALISVANYYAGSRSAGCRAAAVSDLFRVVSQRFGIGGLPLEGHLVHLSARSRAGRGHAARAFDALCGFRSNQPGALLPGTHRGIEIGLAHGARLL